MAAIVANTNGRLAIPALAGLLVDDRQTENQTDSPNALSRSRCRERRLNNEEFHSNALG